MEDKVLDKLLEEAFNKEIIVEEVIVVKARQKAERQREKRERMKDYAPLILMVLLSTIITVLLSGLTFFYIGSMKAFLTFLACGMGITQFPVMIWLLGSLYYKERKIEEV